MKTKQGNWIVECENEEQFYSVKGYYSKNNKTILSDPSKFICHSKKHFDELDDINEAIAYYPECVVISFADWEKLPDEDSKCMPHTNVGSIEKSNKEKESSPEHYDNSKGSIYQFCDNQKLNSYEFDIIKRVARCRKKGNFREDLEKTKFLIDLYLNETEKQKLIQ